MRGLSENAHLVCRKEADTSARETDGAEIRIALHRWSSNELYVLGVLRIACRIWPFPRNSRDTLGSFGRLCAETIAVWRLKIKVNEVDQLYRWEDANREEASCPLVLPGSGDGRPAGRECRGSAFHRRTSDA